MTEAAWIECQEIGCVNGISIDARHWRNFEDRWTCTAHTPHTNPRTITRNEETK